MSIIQGNAHTSTGGYQIERSLRFNSADSAYLNRTFASTGNRRTFTWSGWIKLSKFSYNPYIFSTGAAASPEFISISSGDQLNIGYWNGSTYVYRVQTTQVFRDPSAWYHIVVAYDTTQATASNRIRVYVNGSEVTAFSVSSYPTQNYDSNLNTAAAHYIGSNVSTAYFDGYLTEINFINAQQLTPSSFGETDTNTGVWEPKAYTGTYGTNGFFLKFADNSNTTAGTLGKDSSGNGNNWTPNNFSVTAGAGNDSLVDSPTSYGTDTGVGGEVRGNYCTLNPVKYVTNSITYSNGNLQYKPGSSYSQTTYVEGTIGVLGGSTGKYYWEISSDQAGNLWTAGVALQNNTIGSSNIGTTGSVMIYNTSKYVNGTETAGYSTQIAANGVLGIALDAATGKVWFRNSTGWFGSGDPAAGTNETGIITGFSGGTLVPVTQANSASTVTANFGQRSFSFTAPSGFKALCTQNLPTPTIGATSTTQANKYFDVTTYTGNGTNNRVITTNLNEVGLAWVKIRSSADDHRLANIVTGGNKHLKSNNTDAESTATTVIQAFSGSTFTVGTDNSVNVNGSTYVAWTWAANGTGSTNTAGTITSTVSANTTSGFSIVTYTGTGANATVGHGCQVGGVATAPAFIIIKKRNNTGTAYNWWCWHSAFVTAGGNDFIVLNLTSAKGSGGPVNSWNDTVPSSTVISLGSYVQNNNSGDTFVAYCFAPVAGYSAFGSYVGNGSTDGVFVYLGFRPRFILFKRTNTTESWVTADSARSPENQVGRYLLIDSANAEVNASIAYDFLSNGIKFRNASQNESGSTYIYAAFAEHPFKYSLAR